MGTESDREMKQKPGGTDLMPAQQNVLVVQAGVTGVKFLLSPINKIKNVAVTFAEYCPSIEGAYHAIIFAAKTEKSLSGFLDRESVLLNGDSIFNVASESVDLLHCIAIVKKTASPELKTAIKKLSESLSRRIIFTG